MGFRPTNEDPDLLPLSFDQNDASSYQGYVSTNKKSIDRFLVTYDPEPGVDNVNCNYDIEKPADAVCRFPMNRIPDSCNEENAYGFKSGEPCVFLKLNKVSAPFEAGPFFSELLTRLSQLAIGPLNIYNSILCNAISRVLTIVPFIAVRLDARTVHD